MIGLTALLFIGIALITGAFELFFHLIGGAFAITARLIGILFSLIGGALGFLFSFWALGIAACLLVVPGIILLFIL